MPPVEFDAIKTVLQNYPHLRIAILFGSIAKGTARYDSDLDLAVAFSKPLTVEDKISLITALAETLGRPIDLIDLNTVGEPLLGQILSHGKRLLGNNSDFASLLSKHLFDQADFLPYRNRILKERREAWIGKS
jgi:uncharacterized protein